VRLSHVQLIEFIDGSPEVRFIFKGKESDTFGFAREFRLGSNGSSVAHQLRGMVEKIEQYELNEAQNEKTDSDGLYGGAVGGN